MKKMTLSIATLLAIAALTTGCTNQEVGTTGGAVIGGVAGAAISNGSPVGAVVGAVGGGLVGNALSR
ncbi:MAG: glycine zipper 2TM domain-containing protein [Pseudomonadota bacterium]